MNFDGLFEFRIAQRQKRLSLQISGKDGKPDAGQSENRSDIHQAGNSVRRKLRARQPKQIDEAHENQPQSDFGKQIGVALQVSRKKRKERHEEMEDQDEHSNDAPPTVKS